MVRRHVAQFLLAGLAALVLLAVASLFASRRAGTNEAIRDAKDDTALLARRFVEPRLSTLLLAGQASELAGFDRAMQDLTKGASPLHIRIWATDGRIVYSDQEGLTGAVIGLGDHARAAFDSGEVQAEVSDLSGAENTLERAEGRLLEVYQPVLASDNTPLLLETYYPYSSVSDSAQSIWWDFLPAVIVPLILLELVQIPLAVRLARKVQRAQDERESLLRGVIDASDNERKAIAHDLHDGAVQDLSGATYALSVVSERAARNGDDRSVELLSGAQTDIRRSIQSLRSLFVEIYPPNLQRAGLHVALSDLLAALDGRGITSALHYPDHLELDMDTNAILYRVTQEATRNVMRHANATELSVVIESRGTMVALRIRDDGQGFDPNTDATDAGHLGLPMMADLARQAGGRFEIQAQEGSGTELLVELPL